MEMMSNSELTNQSNDVTRDHVIIKRKLRSNFTVLDNAIILDRRLSWKALGILTFLVSLPPDFKLRLKHLAAQRPTGRDATRAGLRELENAGYLSITVERHVTGRFVSTTWLLTDEPIQSRAASESPGTENPNPAIAKPEKPVPVKPTLTNTKKKQELILKNTTQQSESEGALIFPLVNEREKQQLSDLLSAIPLEMRQDILDELEGKRIEGKLKAGILPLAHYFASNLDKFSLCDGTRLRDQRSATARSADVASMQARAHADVQKAAEEKLKEMTEEQFANTSLDLPPAIRARLVESRNLLKSTEHLPAG